ncbi:hypothetical protein GCM10010919_02080 [Alishewanella longhuensis]|uniref:DUF481 domain-containing protein n=1 Tax=Alishewanella longhuensis TaxID=1091037 RepID=A0ABQ3KW23_9ALTE|nr:DUF481 domain-containing protein [Alishewanella longhuensis]GHG59481.1 hypothetical protein GCM10010919_02080 [Alishewanella longhuensis]
MKVFTLAATAGLLLVSQAQATEQKVWNTSAELGAITTTGNTAGTSITGKIDAKQELEQWSNHYIFSAFFKEDEKTDADGNRNRERSAERYLVSAKGAYKLTEEFDNLFVLGSYTDDKFGAYTQYTTVAAGYGTRLLNLENKSLDVEIGPGYYNAKRSTNETENGLLARGAAAFKWVLSESATFTQTFSVEYSDDNTRTVAETALSARINGAMQMKAAFLVQNDSDVPVDKKSTDTQTSLTLVYSF